MREIRFDGGALCLDYVNTIHNRFSYPPDDYLHNVNNLAEWALLREVITLDDERILKRTIEQKPHEAQAFFEQAINQRELLYSLFHSVSLKKESLQSEINSLNKLFSKYFSHLAIKQKDKQFEEIWNFTVGNLDLLMAPIIKDAYELLLTEKRERIKECSNCGWLFFDTSKNGRRRWCSMKTCGSQVKALEWYYRNKSN